MQRESSFLDAEELAFTAFSAFFISVFLRVTPLSPCRLPSSLSVELERYLRISLACLSKAYIFSIFSSSFSSIFIFFLSPSSIQPFPLQNVPYAELCCACTYAIAPCVHLLGLKEEPLHRQVH